MNIKSHEKILLTKCITKSPLNRNKTHELSLFHKENPADVLRNLGHRKGREVLQGASRPKNKYACNLCPNSYGQWQTLVSHKERRHERPFERKYEEEGCGKMFTSRRSFNYQRKKVHKHCQRKLPKELRWKRTGRNWQTRCMTTQSYWKCLEWTFTLEYAQVNKIHLISGSNLNYLNAQI